MIIWGSGGDAINLGHAAQRHCETCEKEQAFATHLHYRYAHLYYLFCWVTKKQYLLACNVCRNGWVLNAKEVEASLAKHPIPFYRRYGWAVLLGLVVVAFGAASLNT